MIAYATRAYGDAHRVRRTATFTGPNDFFKSEWLESGTAPELSPNIFLVEQPPLANLPAHFHTQNQFQIFVEGRGRLGAHRFEAGKISIHYSGAYTGYGPLVSEDEGFKYFTLRAAYDKGARYLPGAREQMLSGPRVNLHALNWLPPAELEAGPDSASATILESVQEGMCARYWRCKPGSPVTIQPTVGGVFIFVLEGDARLGKASLQRWESAFVSGAEPAVAVEADGGPAAVLELHMPPKAVVYAEQEAAASTPA